MFEFLAIALREYWSMARHISKQYHCSCLSAYADLLSALHRFLHSVSLISCPICLPTIPDPTKRYFSLI